MINKNNVFEKFLINSQYYINNAEYLEKQYALYLEDRNNLSLDWQKIFDVLNNTLSTDILTLKKDVNIQSFNKKDYSIDNNINLLINEYRKNGHIIANTDPLNLKKIKKIEELTLKYYDLEKHLNHKFICKALFNNSESLKKIINKIKKIYINKIGYEYYYLNKIEKLWMQNRIEKSCFYNSKNKIMLLKDLILTESVEQYLHTKYVGQKRFSLEGCEVLIPALKKIIKNCSVNNINSIFLGMAHRGRINVLINIMGKPLTTILKEFEDKNEKIYISGDVKYHLGFESLYKINEKNIHMYLSPNPSHLEAVNPVIEGLTKARQEEYKDDNLVLPILIHGDASFCGQGIVMETLALSQTKHYNTGGTIHLIINNQIGFTTSKKEEMRSSLYCTDIAKMIDSPVFHVNTNDPEAVLHTINIALDYRNTFHKDIVIDLVCYRKYGHNETDEPSGTQPEMYNIIKNISSVTTLYAEHLMQNNVINIGEYNNIVKKIKNDIKNDNLNYPSSNIRNDIFIKNNWKNFQQKSWDQKYDSSIKEDLLLSLSKKINYVLPTITLQKQVKNIIHNRNKMINKEIYINWGFAELLAYGSLLNDGFNIRISGEDTCRGTFSHRHAVLHNYNYLSDIKKYIPLSHINNNVKFNIINTILSEYAVLGFEYGYSCYNPYNLVIWEAQFGDFVNAAQVILDQFICSAEEKWGSLSGLILLLPHGQEGQGSEHSSGRLERFLQNCANHNIQICIPTNPSQIFHLLRRQMLRTYRKPLVILSPKSLLRHPMAVSSWQDLCNGKYENIICNNENHNKYRKILLCSGKIYYDIMNDIKNKNILDILIIRIEQLYPFPQKLLESYLLKYSDTKEIFWVQEEPKNHGAWFIIQHYIKKCLHHNQILKFIGRKASAAPAVGYPSVFYKQQQIIINSALK